jgi:uncharacterized heparinase superfamily protein
MQRRLADWTGLTRKLSADTRRSTSAVNTAFTEPTGALTANGDELTFTFLGERYSCHREQIDWSAPERPQLWRMNLHYMEYLTDCDDKLFADLLGSWILSNGHFRGGAWRDSWNSYALSIRAVVWMQQLASRSDRLPRALITSAEESLARQLSFLEHQLETDIGGNHLIKNIKALLYAGHYFDGSAPRRWARAGGRLLLRQLEEQVLEDGVHYERSLSYHCQVFADLLDCRMVACDMTERLDAVLARMTRPIADLAHPDGKIVQFNDAGLTMAKSPAKCLSAYASLGGAEPGPAPSFCYPEAGYFGLRTPAYYLVVDCGPIGPDDLPAHAHGDVLSVEISAFGQRLFVDQGVFEYVEGPKRQASRSARSHNTLSVDGADQAEFFGAFRCGRRPRAQVECCEFADGSMRFTGSHDGYSRLPGHPIHRRTVNATENLIHIDDRLDATVDRSARISFLLHPDVEVVQWSEGVVLRLPNGTEVRMSSSVPLKVEAAVWWPDMGFELETKRIAAETQSGRAGFRTSVQFASGEWLEREE